VSRATEMRASSPGLNLIDSVYERLLSERIIFLGSQVDDDIANRLCAQILLLAAEDSNKDISLYINSPGGSISAGMAIYDTMVLAPCHVATYGMGMAASMGQFLLAAGTKGKRYALPHARILMHQPLGGVTGSAADIAIQAEQFAVIKQEMFRLNAEFTGQSIERIVADSDRDRWFTAKEALEYGFVDHIITRAETNGAPSQ
jgi:ATP-dependent Clp protease, protease subunit